MEPEENPTQREQGRRAAQVALVLGALGIALFVLLALLDLWVGRSPAQRSFVLTNAECLRCHTEMLARLDEPNVHDPFLRRQCTSCHNAHADSRISAVTPGDYSAWRWLHLTLDSFALDFVWRIFTGPGLLAESGPAEESSAETTPTTPAVMRAGERSLCWTCHGDIGSELYASDVHPPFADGSCTSCHDPHASSTQPLLRGSTEDLCVVCHRIGPELLSPQVHLPFGERRCVDCHAPHSSANAGLLTAEERTLCFGCHGEVAAVSGEAVQHEPFAKACVGDCHKPHTADFAPLLTDVTPSLCYRCHSEVEPQFSLASTHPVPERLDCSDCHSPHASGFRGLLPVSQRRLCLGCHDGVRGDLALPVVHEPVSEDPCTACHKPHGSDAAPLLQATTPELCYACHPDKPPRDLPPRTVRAGSSLGARSYRKSGGAITEGSAMSLQYPGFGPRPRGSDPITLPQRQWIRLPAVPAHPMDGSPVGCEDCHRAHSSENEVLFVEPVNSLCAGCHGTSVRAIGSSGHAKVGCTSCHSLHSGRYAPLLREGNPGVCLRCHPASAFGAGNVHPVTPDFYDTNANEPLTCTSTCHNPHGSRYTRMLRLPYMTAGYGSDYICLVCHRQVGVTY